MPVKPLKNHKIVSNPKVHAMAGAAIGAIIGLLIALPYALSSAANTATCSEGGSSACSLLWLVIVPIAVMVILSQLFAPFLSAPWLHLLSEHVSFGVALTTGAALNGALVLGIAFYISAKRRSKIW